MPWTCPRCNERIERDDTRTCPGCSATKTSWTLFAEQTREITLSVKKRLQLLRGEGCDPVAQGAPWPAELIAAERAPVLEAGEVEELRERGERPGAALVVVCRARPPKSAGAEPPITVEVLFAGREAQTHELPSEPGPAAGEREVRCLFVSGGAAPALEGLHVIDVDEPEGAQGFAPELSFSCGKKPKTLPTGRGGWHYLSARLLDRSGRRTLGNLLVECEGLRAQSDAKGRVLVGAMPAGRVALRYGEGSQRWAPTVPDDAVEVGVVLRGLEGDQDWEGPRQVEGDALPPVWDAPAEEDDDEEAEPSAADHDDEDDDEGPLSGYGEEDDDDEGEVA